MITNLAFEGADLSSDDLKAATGGCKNYVNEIAKKFDLEKKEVYQLMAYTGDSAQELYQEMSSRPRNCGEQYPTTNRCR